MVINKWNLAVAPFVHRFPFKLEFGKLVFVEGGKPGGLQKNPWSKAENQ